MNVHRVVYTMPKKSTVASIAKRLCHDVKVFLVYMWNVLVENLVNCCGRSVNKKLSYCAYVTAYGFRRCLKPVLGGRYCYQHGRIFAEYTCLYHFELANNSAQYIKYDMKLANDCPFEGAIRNVVLRSELAMRIKYEFQFSLPLCSRHEHRKSNLEALIWDVDDGLFFEHRRVIGDQLSDTESEPEFAVVDGLIDPLVNIDASAEWDETVSMLAILGLNGQLDGDHGLDDTDEEVIRYSGDESENEIVEISDSESEGEPMVTVDISDSDSEDEPMVTVAMSNCESEDDRSYVPSITTVSDSGRENRRLSMSSISTASDFGRENDRMSLSPISIAGDSDDTVLFVPNVRKQCVLFIRKDGVFVRCPHTALCRTTSFCEGHRVLLDSLRFMCFVDNLYTPYGETYAFKLSETSRMVYHLQKFTNIISDP